MENKIDQFFKDKVEDHTFPPSEEAWAKVEASLSKKNNIAIWRIAAAILVTGVLVSAIIWSQRDNKNKEQILATKKLPQDNSAEEKHVPQISLLEKKAPVKSNNKKSSIKLSSPRSVSSQTENKFDQKEKQGTETWSVKTQTTAEASVVETKDQTVAVVQENIKVEKINTEATSPATIASTRRKPIKLEFTLENFSDEQPVAVASEEKNSRLKKVWDLALEVKNGNGPVREIKNEIFALNFKKNKSQ